ncbi:SpoIIE family protein phosphatase [Haloferula rosea]|uniref:SpoIIE family protein phosphatase n=1 Tax=Haloferula rosea TaxID=490093 RepID=A0A934R9C4_9BACT|nr:SpoIIE family protein phosphatase [Haloferula rosea]MBK1826747.1 SpoIIE family protein phosphatase [Haloferula rosea]
MSQPDDKAPTGQSEELGRTELALKASNEGIWDWYTDETRIYYSRRILEFLECGEGSAPNLFLPPHEVVHEEDQEAFGRALRGAFDAGGPELLAIDCRLRTGSGGWVWLRIRGSVVRDGKGHTTRIAGSMIDISRRKAAEAQIEEDRHMLRMLIDHVPLQIYFKDTESKFVLVNRQMASWNGKRTPQQVIGKHDRDFFAYDHWKEAAEDELTVMETAEPITGKLEREVRDDAKDTWVLTSKFPWLDRNGSICGTFGVSSDVTDLVEAQQKAAHLAEELSRRNASYEEEVQLAREIQQALASTRFPNVRTKDHELTFGSRYLPISGLAGDFFEVVRIEKGVAGLLICDVMGHGVRAALVVAMLRGLLEKQRESAGEPGTFLSGLNLGLASILERADATMFATAFYAVIDLNADELRYACAGHPAALASGPDGVQSLAAARDERGPGLGIIPAAEFPTSTLSLERVERLMLFTDGLLEAENGEGEPFLETRLIKSMSDGKERPLQAMLDGVLKDVLDYSQNHSFDDDVCLLAMELQKQESRPVSS